MSPQPIVSMACKKKKKPTEIERRSVRARAELSCTDSLLGDRLDEMGTRGSEGSRCAPFMYSRAVHPLFPSSMLASLRSPLYFRRLFLSEILTATSRLARWYKRRSAEREGVGSNPGRTNT